MIGVRVGDDVYELDDQSTDELLRRIRETEPPDHADSEAAESLDHKLAAAAAAEEPAAPDLAELALLGIVIEAWAMEVGTDAADVEDLREAIARELD
jgi:hypothetical protein